MIKLIEHRLHIISDWGQCIRHGDKKSLSFFIIGSLLFLDWGQFRQLTATIPCATNPNWKSVQMMLNLIDNLHKWGLLYLFPFFKRHNRTILMTQKDNFPFLITLSHIGTNVWKSGLCPRRHLTHCPKFPVFFIAGQIKEQNIGCLTYFEYTTVCQFESLGVAVQNSTLEKFSRDLSKGC